MSDERLFASNNPIGRKWYFFNIILLGVITFFGYTIMTQSVIPNLQQEDYTPIANFILNFFYVIMFITFCALIDRRLYDMSGSRDKGIYKTMSPFFVYVILLLIVLGVLDLFPSANTVFKIPAEFLHIAETLLLTVLFILVVAIGFPKGKKSKE